MLRAVLFTTLLLAACASGSSLRERAESACRDQGYTAGPEMDECVMETQEALRRARELPRAPTQRPPR